MRVLSNSAHSPWVGDKNSAKKCRNEETEKITVTFCSFGGRKFLKMLMVCSRPGLLFVLSVEGVVMTVNTKINEVRTQSDGELEANKKFSAMLAE